jgi:non-homologous end joining protein Ku
MLDWQKVIEQALGSATIIIPAALAAMVKLRRLEQNQNVALKNQDRIETKADGNHARALEAVRETSRENVEQLIKAVEKVLTAQSRRAERRSTDDPEPSAKRGRRTTDKKDPEP